jgi:catechol 2,3-dioxygenase-like lactoylglutathione lyase family enzyme
VSPKVWPQPLLVVRDVPAASRFYAALLGADSGHGGNEYEQVVKDGEMILQLHHIDVLDHHGPLASPDIPLGNGVLIWFEVADFEATVERARALEATVERDVHTNPNAQQQEIWLRDPDGYLVVLAGESAYRPRST